MVNMDGEVIPLNVGGTHHLMTERDVLTLCKGSVLEKMFNGLNELKKIEGEVFLDRDGKTFLNLVNYLRNDRTVFPEFMDRNDEIHFFKECDYWKIPIKEGTKYPQSARSQHCCHHNCTYGSPGQGTTATEMRQTVQVRTSTNMNAMTKPASLLNEQEGLTDTSMAAEDSQGVALKAAKDKWNELGPLRLDDIVANSQIPIDQTLSFGQSKYNKYIIGQLGGNGKVTGVGKEINHIIYEGQFVDDVYNGYGRFIYSNGNYYIGNWVDGKRSGYGKLVDKNGKVYEG